jgi:hypothetical protein
MEADMRNVKWLVAVGVVAATAGCVEQTGYPNSSYSANRGYSQNGYNNGYYGNSNSNGYYNTNTSSSSSYNPLYSRSAAAAARQPNRDSDRDGVPNRFQR